RGQAAPVKVESGTVKAAPVTLIHRVSNAVNRSQVSPGRAAPISPLFSLTDGYKEVTTIKEPTGVITFIGQLSFQDDSVLRGKEYFYYVVADNGNEKYKSKRSNILNGMPLDVRADAPT